MTKNVIPHTIDDDTILDSRGRKVGSLMQGINGEWFAITLNEESWAYPLRGRDNVSGYGHPTPEAAAAAYMTDPQEQP